MTFTATFNCRPQSCCRLKLSQAEKSFLFRTNVLQLGSTFTSLNIVPVRYFATRFENEIALSYTRPNVILELCFVGFMLMENRH